MRSNCHLNKSALRLLLLLLSAMGCASPVGMEDPFVPDDPSPKADGPSNPSTREDMRLSGALLCQHHSGACQDARSLEGRNHRLGVDAEGCAFMVNPTPYRINNPGTRQIHLFAEADAEISMNFSMRVGWGVGDGYSETNGDGATVSYNFPILEVTDSEPVNFGDPDGDRIVERAWLTTSNNLQTILGLDYERYLQTADGETELEAELHCRF